MRVVRVDRAVAADIEVRRASRRDGDAIAALCRRVPVAGPAGFTWIDHGVDWWRVVGDRPGRRVLVAERDGVVLGVHAVTVHAARVDDRLIRLALLGPTRIDPSAQGTGVFRALRRAAVGVVDEAAAEPYALVPVGDPPGRLPPLLRRWPVRCHRAVIDCRAAADASSERRRADVGAAADLLARTRDRAALAPADIDGALERRLMGGRGYGRDRLLTNGDAVVGVSRWAATARDDRDPRPRRQATAWDVGATSAAALESLVRAWCSRLVEEGVDDLVVWSSTGDLVHHAVAPLARTVTAHVVDLGLTPPPDAASRGIHVDASLL